MLISGAAGGLYTRGCCAAVAKVGDAKITKIYIYSDKKIHLTRSFKFKNWHDELTSDVLVK